ncbi:MAG: WGR domain-containing protein [Polyangiaceae bacterium]
MRRFELVEGKSAKFWQADVAGTTFIVEYGRLGTAGQRKEKDFGDELLAKRELEKKITEKLREGYSEVVADGGASAPKGAKGAQAASAKLDLPPRLKASAKPPTDAAIRWATTALDRLAIAVGRRSYVTAHAARQARRGLELLGGADPSAHPALAAALDRVLDFVAHEHGPRLSMAHAMALLEELPTASFERAMERWSAAKKAPASVAFLASEVEALGDAELTFRLGSLLLDRPGRSGTSAAGWSKRLGALLPHLQAHLARRSSTPRKHLGSLDARGDELLAARIAEASKAAGA